MMNDYSIIDFSKNQNFKEKIAILGFGREGQSVFRFLKKSPAYRDAEIWVLDKDTTLKLGKIKSRLGLDYLKNLTDFDIIFRSPGIPYSLPEIQKAQKSGVEISSLTKLFFEEVKKIQRRQGGKPKIIGVTGTKGKGTTATLIYQILKKSGFRTILAGNIGKPMLDYVEKATKADFLVLELSSFQLHDLTASPDIAVILDIFPDHLDAHASLKEYYDAKASIGRFQKKSDRIFYFSTNPLSKQLAAKSPAKKIAVTPKEDNLKKNYLMAATVGRSLGATDAIIEKTIKSFKGLEHRVELVRELHGIQFYNDSCATNPTATAAAIHSFQAPVILIAGGKDTKFDYRPLAKALKNSTVKLVLLFGENKKKIASAIKPQARMTQFCPNVQSALRVAYSFAKKFRIDSADAVVLFSPASKSFDMFKNYAERGKAFKKLVRKIR